MILLEIRGQISIQLYAHQLQKTVELARWFSSTLEARVTRKFGQRGWVKFELHRGVINSMIIGPAMSYSQWIEGTERRYFP